MTPEQAAAEYGRKVGNPAVVNRVDFSAGWRAREPEVAALRKVVEAANNYRLYASKLGLTSIANKLYLVMCDALAALDKEQGRG